jgi:hypothetical protein
MTTPDPVERPTFDYTCLGGPLDGQQMISRFPAGFLLVEKSTSLVWFYDRSQVDDPSWQMRDGSPFIWDRVRSHAAAEGNDYDVIALGAGEQT